MTVRHLIAACAALLLAAAPIAQAQKAAAPAAAASTAAPAPAPAVADASQGKVAYYGRKFAGRKTASGERFNPHALTMAHKTLPFGTLVRVTHLTTNKRVVVRVNDRGPSTPDRVGDLSRAAAAKIRMLHSGVVEAKLEVVGQAKRHAKAHRKARKA